MTVQIEKGIPIPHPGSGRLSYPFHEMKVGDSILVTDRTLPQLERMTGSYGRRHGVKFSLRKMKGGVRIWRVK